MIPLLILPASYLFYRLARYEWQRKKPKEERVHEQPPAVLKTRPVPKDGFSIYDFTEATKANRELAAIRPTNSFGMHQFDSLFAKSLENDQKVNSSKPIGTLSMRDFNRAVRSQQELRAKYPPNNSGVII